MARVYGRLHYWPFLGTSLRKKKSLDEICELYNVLVHPAHIDPPLPALFFCVWQQGCLMSDTTSNKLLLYASARDLGRWCSYNNLRAKARCWGKEAELCAARGASKSGPILSVCITLQKQSKIPWITDLLLNAIKGAKPRENRGRLDTPYLESLKLSHRHCRNWWHKMSA